MGVKHLVTRRNGATISQMFQSSLTDYSGLQADFWTRGKWNGGPQAEDQLIDMKGDPVSRVLRKPDSSTSLWFFLVCGLLDQAALLQYRVDRRFKSLLALLRPYTKLETTVPEMQSYQDHQYTCVLVAACCVAESEGYLYHMNLAWTLDWWSQQATKGTVPAKKRSVLFLHISVFFCMLNAKQKSSYKICCIFLHIAAFFCTTPAPTGVARLKAEIFLRISALFCTVHFSRAAFPQLSVICCTLLQFSANAENLVRAIGIQRVARRRAAAGSSPS